MGDLKSSSDAGNENHGLERKNSEPLDLAKNKLKNMDMEYSIYLLISNADKRYRLCNKITENKIKSDKDNRSRNRGKIIETCSPKELKIAMDCILCRFNITDNKNLLKKDKKSMQLILKKLLFNNNMYFIH